MNQSTTVSSSRLQQAFNASYLVDAHGREVQITEHMIQNACQALRQRCRRPKQM
jgi:sugar (pentulose or hexulose) kinase